MARPTTKAKEHVMSKTREELNAEYNKYMKKYDTCANYENWRGMKKYLDLSKAVLEELAKQNELASKRPKPEASIDKPKTKKIRPVSAAIKTKFKEGDSITLYEKVQKIGREYVTILDTYSKKEKRITVKEFKARYVA